MSNKDFGLKLIRKYHGTLLRFAKVLREIRELIRKDDFMDMEWKCDVARNFVQTEKDAREVVGKIRELREEYKCLDY